MPSANKKRGKKTKGGGKKTANTVNTTKPSNDNSEMVQVQESPTDQNNGDNVSIHNSSDTEKETDTNGHGELETYGNQHDANDQLDTAADSKESSNGDQVDELTVKSNESAENGLTNQTDSIETSDEPIDTSTFSTDTPSLKQNPKENELPLAKSKDSSDLDNVSDERPESHSNSEKADTDNHSVDKDTKENSFHVEPNEETVDSEVDSKLNEANDTKSDDTQIPAEVDTLSVTKSESNDDQDDESSADDERESLETDGSEEEDEDDSDSESDSDDEEEEEPRLKYSRILTLPRPVFNSDPVSTCIISDKFLVVATHGGYIHICQPDSLTTIRSYRAHSASVLALSTDGHYVASASMDGRVVVSSITDPTDIVASDFHRPVHTVALDPNYKSSKIFISGGMAGDVILSEKGWLGNRSDTVIQHSEDPVTAVYWLEGLIICLDESGINVFGQHSREVLLHIDRPAGSPRADLYKPRLCSPESNRIYIGWVDRIWNLKIEGNVASMPSSASVHSRDNSKVDSSATSKFGQEFFKKTLISSGASMILPSSSSIRLAQNSPQVILESSLQIDSLVAGISSFGQDTLMVLSYRPPGSDSSDDDDQVRRGRPLAPPPEIRLIDLDSGEEVYADELSLNGYERLGLNDYHLLQFSDATSNKYFIISAKDGVVAVERDLSDRIDWLLEHKLFEEAWNISASVKTSEERLNIGIDWVETFLDRDMWEEAAQKLKTVLDTFLATADQGKLVADNIMGVNKPNVDKSTMGQPTLHELNDFEKIAQENWNRWAFIFTQSGHSPEIAQVLPNTTRLQIDPKIYEKVLSYFIDNDKLDEVLKYLGEWPCQLYDSQPIKSSLEALVRDAEYDGVAGPRKRDLEKALANLYILSGDPGSAVSHLLALHDESVLDLVSQYHLLPVIKNRIPDLMTVSLPPGDDVNKAPLPIVRETLANAISIVVRARTEVVPDEIVRQIMSKGDEIVAFLYLEQLNLVDSFAAQKFGDLQVKLYSEFDRPKLIGFLKKSNNYNLEKALAECEKRGYVPEQVYILGKVGQNKQALKLVIENLQDPEQAIDFAKAQKDAELWDDLINYCLEKPSFIRVLLTRASNSVNVARVLKLLPEHIQIPGIRDALLHIFMEYELVVSLNSGILDIVRHEAQTQATTLFQLRKEGTLVDFERIAEQAELRGDTSSTVSRKKGKTKLLGARIASAAGLDLSGSIVIKPDGTLVNEAQLLGEEQVQHLWPQGGVLATGTSPKTVSQKIKHLAYIKQLLRSQLK